MRLNDNGYTIVNIFVIDTNPERAAIQLHDRHVVKMILESAQMLSTTRRYFNDDHPLLYKSCFLNHPCTVWVRECLDNYAWLCRHMRALCSEYTYRYNKTHICEKMLPVLSRELNGMSTRPMSPFVVAAPVEYKQENPIQAYRDYYIGRKIEGNYRTRRGKTELDSWLSGRLMDTQFKTTF